MVDELATTLSLTEIQKTQVSELHFAHFKEAKEAMESNRAKNEEQREVMDNIRKNFEEQVKAILTDEQDEQFEIFLKDHRPPHCPKRDAKRN